MALTDAQICNVALSRIGVRAFINDLNDNTIEAQVCKTHFADLRNLVLEEGDFPWARDQATLAQLSGTVPSGWAYMYSLPTTCLRARYVYAGARLGKYIAENRIPFTVKYGGSSNAPVLLTDHSAPELIFTVKDIVVALWTPLARDALAWRLAPELALGLAVKPALGKEMLERAYTVALHKAIASSLNSQQEDVEQPSEFEQVR